MAYEYGNLKWSEMTDEQRESAGSKSEHKAAKNAYEESQSTPAPTPTPDDSNPLNSKYSEMSDTYKENTSKADHKAAKEKADHQTHPCLLYTSPSPRDRTRSRMPSSA